MPMASDTTGWKFVHVENVSAEHPKVSMMPVMMSSTCRELILAFCVAVLKGNPPSWFARLSAPRHRFPRRPR